MRWNVLLLFAFAAVICPVLGCGESAPDPRDNPNFVDTSDPTALPMIPPPMPPTAENAGGGQPAGGAAPGAGS